jgi:hypothetical protein
MPLPLETTPVLPNAVYLPQIVIHTGIVNGQLQSRVTLVLSGATVDNAGKDDEQWTDTGGPVKSEQIDLSALPKDLTPLAPQIAELYTQIVTVAGAINSLRKIL